MMVNASRSLRSCNCNVKVKLVILIAAVAPRFDSTPTDELSLHLPDGFGRSALPECCFASPAKTVTTLRNGLSLIKEIK